LMRRGVVPHTVIPALRSLKQEDHEFETSVSKQTNKTKPIKTVAVLIWSQGQRPHEC
jgi:hypothetical protein